MLNDINPKFFSQMNVTVPDAGMNLALRPANERRRYKVTPFLIGLAQTYRISLADEKSTLMQAMAWCHNHNG